jgi:hypothetical protein
MKKLIVIGVLLGCLGCTPRQAWVWVVSPISALDPVAGVVYTGLDIAADYYVPGEVREDEQMDVPSR